MLGGAKDEAPPLAYPRLRHRVKYQVLLVVVRTRTRSTRAGLRAVDTRYSTNDVHDFGAWLNDGAGALGVPGR